MPDYKVLLVEDDVDAAEMIVKNLHLKKFKDITHVVDSDGAMDAVSKSAFDVVLMDIQLPGGKNGIEVTEDILALVDVPVIFITANNISDEYESLIRSNPYGFLSKPIKINDLVISIDICIERHKIHLSVQENQTKLKLATQVLELLNQAESTHDVISDILFIIKAFLGFDAVGLKINKQHDSQYVINSDDDYKLKNIFDIYDYLSIGKNTRVTNTAGGSSYYTKVSVDEVYEMDGPADVKDCNVLFVPLLSDLNEIGTLFAFNNSEISISDETIRFLERISNSIGLSISRKNAASKIKQDFLKIKDLEETINKSPIVAFEISKADDFKIINISDSIGNFNFKAEKLIGEKFGKLLGENGLEEFQEKVEQLDSDDKTSFITLRIVNRKTVYWADCYLWIDKNNSKFIKGVFHDVSKRYVAEESLHNSQVFLESILSQLEAAILVIDQNAKLVVAANEKAYELLEAEENSLVGLRCDKFICNVYEDNANICSQSKNVVNVESRIKVRDDKEIIVKKSVMEVVYNGKPHHVVILFDITDEKNRASQLSQMRKLESIGQLAAGIAHEINTPTQYIGDNIVFLSNAMSDLIAIYKRMFDACPQTCDKTFELKALFEEYDLDYLLKEIPIALNQSKEGIERVSKIVSAMKKFSHPGTDEKSLLNLNESLENTLIVSRNQWKYFANLEKDFDETLDMVLCYPADLNQALLNVIVNAAQAIEEKKKTVDFQGEIKISTYKEDDNAVIKVTDNGIGMNDEVKDKIFDPFFTTKDIGKGTGQGLPIVYSIIHDKHKGSIRYESELGVGTTCVIKVPLRQQ